MKPSEKFWILISIILLIISIIIIPELLFFLIGPLYFWIFISIVEYIEGITKNSILKKHCNLIWLILRPIIRLNKHLDRNYNKNKN